MNETLIRIILDILVVIMIILVLLWKAVAAKKNGRAMAPAPVEAAPINLELIPGHSEACQLRGTELTKLGENYKSLTGSIARIDKNVSNLWTYVKKNGIN